MNEPLPLVSIGIPTYNRAALIGRAIESALKQDYANIEILISDNASTDGTAEVCEAWAARDRRIRLLRQTDNRGPTANFNMVLGLTGGKYFMWLGDDDYIDPHYVGSAVSALESDPRIELFSGAPHYYRDGAFAFAGKHISASSPKAWRRLASYYWQVTDNGVFYGLMRGSTARRLSIPNVMGGDWLFIGRLAAAGSIVMSRNMTVHRELGGASVSHRATARSLGLSSLNALFPKLSLTWNVSRDIASGGYPFANSGFTNKMLAALMLLLMLMKTMQEKLVHLARRSRNLLKRLTPSYHMNTRSR